MERGIGTWELRRSRVRKEGRVYRTLLPKRLSEGITSTPSRFPEREMKARERQLPAQSCRDTSLPCDLRWEKADEAISDHFPRHQD